jgi:glycosyltransferase involved in cell wall biosynthesis
MDGMEWQRAKYSKKVRNFLRYAEALAVRYSHYHIADSEVIKTYLDQKYGINSKFIPYGAALLNNRDITGILGNYSLQAQRYFLLMARMEPENNIEMILDGFQFAATTHSFVVIGNTNNKYGRYLVEKYRHNPRIVFLGGVFNASIVHALKAGSLLYFHGHSVGGTNPSLLEAMASRALIAAHNNPFNAAILGDHAFFFASANDVQLLVETVERTEETAHMIEANYQKITEEYTWNRIVDQYETFLYQCYKIRGIREPVIRHLHEVKHIK